MSELTVDEQPVHHHNNNLTGLSLAALGIVFGDIGTSPLYTLKTVLTLAGGVPTAENLLGLLSLIIWTLLITVSLKYVTFVMRADNGGEGGILALMSLLRVQKQEIGPVIIALGLFGAALIYGDGAITPAISVLSAVEGLKMAAFLPRQPMCCRFRFLFCWLCSPFNRKALRASAGSLARS